MLFRSHGGCLTQLDVEATNTKSNQYRLHSVHDTGSLPDQRLTLAMRTLRVFLCNARDGHHVAVLWLAAQPAENRAQEQSRVKAVSFGSPMLPRYWNTRRVDHVGLYASSP